MSSLSGVSYALSELRKHADDPNWYRERFIDYGLGGVHRRIWPRYRGSTRVMDEDWDNLIVLDACRRQLFESVIDIGDAFDEYRTIRSLGSNTGEWTVRNFNDDSHRTEFGDTVYVTSNVVMSRRITEPTFHRLDEVWQDAFDDELGTVPPEPVVDRAIQARDAYPNKRLVTHVLQPHQPFITPATDGNGYSADPERVFGSGTVLEEDNVWYDLAAGNVNVETVKEAYARTLEIGWTAVRRLLDELSGRTVVTTDHGNMWGERASPFPVPIYGHPTRVRCRQLVDVPWGVVEAIGDRPEITEGRVRGIGSSGEADPREQLGALGYLD
jgi:hypothetical protein